MASLPATNFSLDLRQAFRVLRKNPSFTLIAVVALALGIGANTVIFTAFNAVLLRPLPYHDPERIVTVWDAFPQQNVSKFGVTYANMMDIKVRNHVFAPLGLYIAQSNTAYNLTGAAGPERGQGTQASAEFFKALATPPLAGGGALGRLFAAAGIRLLVALAPADLPRIADASLDGRVLLFTIALSLVTEILFGLAPALHAARVDLNRGLKDAGRGVSTDRRQNRLRSLLVIGEVTLMFVLLVAAGLMLKSFQRLLDVAPGFETRNVLSARVTLPARSYPPAKKLQFYRRLVEDLGRQPGVAAAGVIRDLPLSGTDPRYGFSVTDRPADNNNGFTYRYRVASADYFSVMGIALKRGRFFTDHDDAKAQGVAIINETAAHAAWPTQDPIGQSITVPGPTPGKCVVIGVVGDVKFGGLETQPDAEIFYHYPQVPEATMQGTIGSMAVVVRTAAQPAAFSAALRHTVAALDQDVPVTSIKPMDDVLIGSVAGRRFNLFLLGGFAGAALLLASIGTYGVISYWVAQRTREIGIRLALGAESRDIFRLVVWQAMSVVLLGLGLGLVIAVVGARFLPAMFSGLLFGVSAFDPATLGIVGGLLTFVALLASYLPARRAIRVEPAVALHCE